VVRPDPALELGVADVRMGVVKEINSPFALGFEDEVFLDGRGASLERELDCDRDLDIGKIDGIGPLPGGQAAEVEGLLGGAKIYLQVPLDLRARVLHVHIQQLLEAAAHVGIENSGNDLEIEPCRLRGSAGRPAECLGRQENEDR